ncbi:FtsK/SpoIIIE family DNA translocase [Sandaracinobacteroides saxicola]|uniref:DNA translocase FtsK n=1 Tax=Sandaracinobacteroides saxicola TaxID=2759707 RepID=A0A7G5IEL3_9SPHN|nr:DNA translocase FtsK [Sandaracinobacteroides saxicola]QMW21805.1 DNA translocase FtsK 4TM domain-containing protein [Sandaracinobacteroides saxicola]
MASNARPLFEKPDIGGAVARGRAAVGRGVSRFLRGVLVVGLLALGFGILLALVSYDPGDPSLNHVTERAAVNWLGRPGAFVADLGLQGFGYAAVLLAVLPLVAGVKLLIGQRVRWRRALLWLVLAMLLAAFAAGLLWRQPLGLLDAGPGGVAGLIAAKAVDGGSALLLPSLDPALLALGVAGMCALGALGLLLLAIDLPWRAMLARRAVVADEAPPPLRVRPVREPAVVPVAENVAAPTRPIRAPAAAASSKREAVERQSALALGDVAALPPLSLLKPRAASTVVVDEAALEQNARLLEGVLDDFGVKGRIVGLSQGPVVTLYELEPAPGIKASRVIGLSDDIARSMSAISARVAVIPGRNVIGIELPNARREMVSLSELLASAAFENSGCTLPLVLGKDISGAPVVADLAPMPHLLIAGTTGSGKSVGLNAMILSLLYRLRPDQCKLIMIDPKMLELSVYDEIPHLLAPVVTEPQKAVRALKWAVEQMEDRYRNMAHINVRSIGGFNERVRAAQRAGQSFTKKIQTGWDEDGRPEYEEQTLPLEVLPLIVVVVDELADLMMTAGKEVEFLIQRLAQKARAAGIHLIMATQRPSVDVITGVIKANLPTRISFSVTSKIDSRTILGEQGAEQLLGKGDMLYMPGGKAAVRVHGPFVSDEEVEAVAAFWKAQGSPDYVHGVTEEPPEGDGSDGGVVGGGPGRGGGGGSGVDAEADTLTQAIQVVATSRRATISYLQRTLRVGYNSAARLIEQMEEMGLVSKPDHVGRREVLMGENGERL